MLERGPVAWMARNPVAANLLMLMIVISGLMSINSIRKETFPSVPSEMLTITVPYPGSSPEEIEEGVIIKIEEAIQDLDGIDDIDAVAGDGMALITVEIEAGGDISDMLNKVKARVDGIAAFPAEAEPPVISEVLARYAVANLTIYGNASEAALKQLADDYRDRLLRLPGITQVDILGTRDYEIAIEMSSDKLRQYGLRFDDVVAAVRNQSRDLPGGFLRTSGGRITLRAQSQARTAAEYEALTLVTRTDGTRVLLGDVARVIEGFDEQKPLLSRYNGNPAVTLAAFSIGDQDAIAISDTMRAFADRMRVTLPEGVDIRFWNDRTRSLKERMQMLLDNLLMGGLLVTLVLALLLELRLAFWVALGIPICFLGALAMMRLPFIDDSINVISLFGFILVLGISVDDAIITAESAYAELEKENKGIESVIRGVKKISISTIFGVTTTIVAFVPLLFLSQGMGRMFNAVGTVVILCLLFSILETKLILPSHLGHSRSRYGDHSRSRFMQGIEAIQHHCNNAVKAFTRNIYQPLLVRAVRARYLTLSLFIALLIIATALVPSGALRFVFFPVVPTDDIYVTLTMPAGTTYALTHDYAQRIEQATTRVNQRFRKATGEDRDVIEHIYVLSIKDTEATMQAALIPSAQRTISSVELAQWWREETGLLPGIRDLTLRATAGPGGNALDIKLESDDLVVLRKAASELKQMLASYDGVRDIRDTLGTGEPEVEIEITAEGIAQGLGQVELARQVRQAFYGAEVQRIQHGRHETRVYARLTEQERSTLQTLQNLWIRLPNGNDVPFAAVATAKPKSGISTIHRINRQRVANVIADIDKSRVEPDRLLASLEAEALKTLGERYPNLRYRFGGQAEEQSDSLHELLLGTLLTLVMIYAALAIPLKSYGQPLLIMAAIPFGIVGALIGHLLFGLSLSILSMIGIVALAGIAVNDALVLVDFINQEKAEGRDVHDAIMAAGARRFRAVLLTSSSTFIGLLPIQLETSMQAQFLKPMAISIGCGVLFASAITLVLVPVLFFVVEDVRRAFSRLRA